MPVMIYVLVAIRGVTKLTKLCQPWRKLSNAYCSSSVETSNVCDCRTPIHASLILTLTIFYCRKRHWWLRNIFDEISASYCFATRLIEDMDLLNTCLPSILSELRVQGTLTWFLFYGSVYRRRDNHLVNTISIDLSKYAICWLVDVNLSTFCVRGRRSVMLFNMWSIPWKSKSKRIISLSRSLHIY